MAALPREQWHADYAKPMKGECDGLIEIRFSAGNVPQRPLGFISGAYEFTMLFWATEHNNRLVPKGACKTALQWKASSLRNRSLTDDLWFPLE